MACIRETPLCDKNTVNVLAVRCVFYTLVFFDQALGLSFLIVEENTGVFVKTGLTVVSLDGMIVSKHPYRDTFKAWLELPLKTA